MSEALTLTVTTPSEPALATGGADFASSSSPRDSEDRDELSSGEESAAAAALLGLGSAWPSSPDDEGGDDDQGGSGFGYDAAVDLWDATNAAAGYRVYDSPGDAYSPKTFRGSLDYDTPGNPSPKRMRAPKDGMPHCSPRPPHPPAPSLHLPPWAASGSSRLLLLLTLLPGLAADSGLAWPGASP